MFEEFYEMYEPEEQEVVALINRCIGGGYNWKGNFWEMTVVTLGVVFCAVSYTHLKKLVAEQEAWDKSLRAMAAQKLTAQANEWLADNDQTDRAPEKDPITENEFARRILLTEFTVSPGGRFTAWYEDDDMFWGHVITVEGTLKKGPVGADIQG